MILPRATDTASSVSKQAQAEWVDLLGELEAMKNTVTATQARLAVALEEATKADEAKQGIRAERRGRGVPNQVGAALQSSPHAGASFLGTARVWVTGMPFTFDALRTGVLSSWRATLLVRETSHLSAEDRARIDEEICGPAALTALARTGTRRLVARVKELAGRLDVQACVKRNAKAVAERCVSVRPAPDLMVYLTALVPMQQGVQAYAQLKAHAEAAKATGDGRGAGQIMADTLIERVTSREPGKADDVPVTINLLVSDQTLLAGGDQPGVVVEGAPAGVGTVPGPVAHSLAAHGIDTDAAWLRAIYVDPRGRLLATTSTSRFHPPGLAALLRARGQGICATSWCDAPVRHIDHVVPHAEGGETSLDNGQGLCVRCNHAKQAPGWRQKVTEIDGRHAVETTTPTGHTSVSVVPVPPEPVTSTGHDDTSSAPRPPQPVQPTGHTHTRTSPVVSRPPAPARDEAKDGAERPAPAWTPAVGMNGPGKGRIPRSRYSIGCAARRPRGAIAYRPPGRRGAARPRSPRRSRPDLAWAHTR
ncbi:HNH endonuclease [Promicromonospora sp. AC04]|uniref:HNH endonuclease n=1 Tax=Promicromonospora sp. AC04 TaxID=2135723 RepID=UPI000D36CDBC|nr:HNH endonuclease [Promicromonospora sp. AC04]